MSPNEASVIKSFPIRKIGWYLEKYCILTLKIPLFVPSVWRMGLQHKKFREGCVQLSPKHCPSLVCWRTFENIFWPYFCGTVFGFSMKSENVSPSIMSNSLLPYGLYPARLLCPWDFPGKNSGVGCHSLLQASSFRIFLLVWNVMSSIFICEKETYRLLCSAAM